MNRRPSVPLSLSARSGYALVDAVGLEPTIFSSLSARFSYALRRTVAPCLLYRIHVNVLRLHIYYTDYKNENKGWRAGLEPASGATLSPRFNSAIDSLASQPMLPPPHLYYTDLEHDDSPMGTREDLEKATVPEFHHVSSGGSGRHVKVTANLAVARRLTIPLNVRRNVPVDLATSQFPRRHPNLYSREMMISPVFSARCTVFSASPCKSKYSAHAATISRSLPSSNTFGAIPSRPSRWV